MSASIGYTLMATTGLLSGFGHCIGMCGPLVATYAVQSNPNTKGQQLFQHLLYNAGRITTYTLIGAAMGLVGSFVQLAANLGGLQRLVMIVAGLVLVLSALNMAGWLPGRSQVAHTPGLYQRLVHRLIARTRGHGHFLLGLALGLMPCGLLYTVEIAAAASADPLVGAGLMASFGLGTMPALLLVGMLASSIGPRLRGSFYKLACLLIALSGCVMMARGFGLPAIV